MSRSQVLAAQQQADDWLRTAVAQFHPTLLRARNRIKIKGEVSCAYLREIVYENVREGDLYEKLDRNRVRCYACGHCCPIPDGQPGVCKSSLQPGRTLYVPWGYVGGVQCDPIEKKPFFHAYPGALAYSFGMLGCDLHCALLSELGDFASVARSRCGVGSATSLAGSLGAGCPAPGSQSAGQHLQRASDHRRMGGCRYLSKRKRPA